MFLKSMLFVTFMIKVISSQYVPCSCQRQVTEIIEPLPPNRDPEYLSNAIQSVIISKLRKTAAKTPIFGSISQPIIDELTNRLCPACSSKTISSTPVVLSNSVTTSCTTCNSLPCNCKTCSNCFTSIPASVNQCPCNSNSIVISTPTVSACPSPIASPCSKCASPTPVSIQSSCSKYVSPVVSNIPSPCSCNTCSSLVELINNINSQCGCSLCLNKLSEVLSVANGMGSAPKQIPACANNKYAELLSIVNSFRNPTCSSVNTVFV